MTRPRAADDFATIRARMEELRRERAPTPQKESRDPEAGGSGSRSLLRGSETRQRSEGDRWSASPSSRRYGSGR
ncbi:MAG: hypothetical protein JO096_02165 [Alphaproteobacteria bacterium]|nr:hypothetical protein [Alphaproteobacteria bacterium]